MVLPDKQVVLERLNHCRTELSSAYRERGDMQAVQINNHADAWMNSGGVPVTERRENVRAIQAHLLGELAKLDGEISALETEQEYLKVLLNHVNEG